MVFPIGFRLTDSNGKPVVGGKIYVYDAGTTDLASIYEDTGLSSPQTNPVVSLAGGTVPQTYASGGQLYKFVYETSTGATVMPTEDNVALAITNQAGALPVANGGTAATTAAGARTSLGAAAASDVSSLSSTVTTISTEQDTTDWQAGTSTTASVVSPADAYAMVKALGKTGIPDAVIYDEKTTGTDGGTFTQDAWQTRTLNTEYDPGSLVALSSNVFTPTKNGFVFWMAPARRCGLHKSRLYNVTDTSVSNVSLVGYADTGTATSDSISFGWSLVTAAKQYRLEHYCATTRDTNGFGANAGFSEVERYATVFYWSDHEA